jgi:hypothetical protein
VCVCVCVCVLLTHLALLGPGWLIISNTLCCHFKFRIYRTHYHHHQKNPKKPIIEFISSGRKVPTFLKLSSLSWVVENKREKRLYVFKNDYKRADTEFLTSKVKGPGFNPQNWKEIKLEVGGGGSRETLILQYWESQSTSLGLIFLNCWTVK